MWFSQALKVSAKSRTGRNLESGLKIPNSVYVSLNQDVSVDRAEHGKLESTFHVYCLIHTHTHTHSLTPSLSPCLFLFSFSLARVTILFLTFPSLFPFDSGNLQNKTRKIIEELIWVMYLDKMIWGFSSP